MLRLPTLDTRSTQHRVVVTPADENDGDDRPDHVPAADALYDKLAVSVLPLYYRDRTKWIWMMKQAIGKIACYFNSHRMMRRYAAEAYIR